MTDPDENPAADEAAGQKDYNDAWSELEAADKAAEDHASADDEDADRDDPPPDEGRDDPAARDDDDGDDDEGEDDARGADDDASSNGPDWSAAPEPLKKAYEGLADQLRSAEHARNSDRGRLAAQDRKLNELSRQLAEVTTRPNGPAGDGKPKTLKELIAAMGDVREEYGEVAGPLADAIEAMGGQLQQLQQEREQVQIAGFQRNLNDLNAEIPHWTKILGGERGEKFGEVEAWVRHPDTPRKYGEIWAENQTKIVDKAATADLIRAYAKHTGVEIAASGAPDGDASLDRRRQRQKAASTLPGGRGRATSSSEPGPDAEYDRLWDHFDKKDKAAG